MILAEVETFGYPHSESFWVNGSKINNDSFKLPNFLLSNQCQMKDTRNTKLQLMTLFLINRLHPQWLSLSAKAFQEVAV